MCPRLVGYFWKVTGTRSGCNCRTYFCHVSKTEQEAIEYAESKGWRNVIAERWCYSEKEKKNAENNQGLSAVPVLQTAAQ